jgi:6-phosphogluconolactonase (cycloisomerase 2 family)
MSNNQGTAAARCRGRGDFRARSRATWIAAIAAAVAVSGPAPREASAQWPRATNIVYVESNDPAANKIFAFARNDADGRLTPLPGSPFDAAGLGINFTSALGPFDSDQEVIVNADHTMLFAVNGGSNTIAIFWINADGSLTPVHGSPFPSGGSNPVSVGLAGRTLCVVNKDEDPGNPGQFLPNYTSFRLSERGQLTPVPNSTFTDDLGSDPSQALIAPDDRLLFGADFLGGLLRSFQIRNNGRLVPSDAQPLPPSIFGDTGDPPLPLGLAVHPTENILYVDFVTINLVGVYRYDHRGRLNFVRAVPISGQGPCWALVNRAGTRLYTSNTADASVSVLDITKNPTTPVEIQHVKLKTTGNCFQFKLDSKEKFLHVVTQRTSLSSPASANALHVLSVAADGTLTEVPSSPTILPVGPMVRPQGVAAL